MRNTMNKQSSKVSKDTKKNQKSVKSIKATKTSKATDNMGNKSMKIYTIVNPVLHKKIKGLAAKQEISISKFIHAALQAYIK